MGTSIEVTAPRGKYTCSIDSLGLDNHCRVLDLYVVKIR